MLVSCTIWVRTENAEERFAAGGSKEGMSYNLLNDIAIYDATKNKVRVFFFYKKALTLENIGRFENGEEPWFLGDLWVGLQLNFRPGAKEAAVGVLETWRVEFHQRRKGDFFYGDMGAETLGVNESISELKAEAITNGINKRSASSGGRGEAKPTQWSIEFPANLVHER
ncbi:MAG: hypothetical protein ACREOW_00090 [Thermodesulfobacteriota bacterium]